MPNICVRSVVIPPKILGKKFGYPTKDPRWGVWLSCLRSWVRSVVILAKIPGEEVVIPPKIQGEEVVIPPKIPGEECGYPA